MAGTPSDSSQSLPHAYSTIMSISSLDEIPLSQNLARKQVKRRAIHDARDLQRLPAEAVNAIVLSRKPSEEEMDIIFDNLARLFVLNHTDLGCKMQIVDSMTGFQLSAGDYVFHQGQRSARFYVVVAGTLESIVNSKHLHTLGKGAAFSELALLHEMPHAFSVRATECSTLWAVDRPTVRRILRETHAKLQQEKLEIVQKVALFKALSEKQKDAVAQSCAWKSVPAGATVAEDGSTEGLLLVVTHGEVVCMKGDIEVRRLHAGDSFGEDTLVYGASDSPRLVAAGPARVLQVTVQELQRALGSALLALIHQTAVSAALGRSGTLCSPELLSKLQFAMKVCILRRREEILMYGPAKVYIVLKGRVSVGGEEVTAPYFIDPAANYSKVTVESGDCEVAEWPKHVFELCMRQGTGESKAGRLLYFLQKVPVFNTLPQDLLESLSAVTVTQSLQLSAYTAGDSLYPQHSEGTDLFFIKSGQVEMKVDGRCVRVAGKYDYIGESAVLTGSRCIEGAIARTVVTCYRLAVRDIPQKVVTALQPLLQERVRMQHTAVQYESLCLLRLLGRGMFGDVILVKDRSTEELYAGKVVWRSKVRKYRLATCLKCEREVLSQVSHPMIVRFHGTFKDSEKVCFLLEYINGVDLFSAIREIGYISESEARFYVSSLILALEYLHDRDILYRDLKPENVMLDENGYPKLVDFGSAKWSPSRTYTVAGTPHYMAPEVILGNGYNQSADYWSLGIMLYEFLCGGVPFGEELEKPYEIYEEVLQGRLTFPIFMESQSLVQRLIEQLLSRNPSARLGGNISMLKQHPWLRCVDWRRLQMGELQPPYVPGPQSIEEETVTFAKEESEPAEELGVEEDWDRDF